MTRITIATTANAEPTTVDRGVEGIGIVAMTAAKVRGNVAPSCGLLAVLKSILE